MSAFWLTILMMYLISGCSKTDSRQNDAYLIKAGESRITSADFAVSLETAKTAYSFDSIQNPLAFGKIRLEVLKQLVERVVLMERARESGLEISEAELQKAITLAKQGYPENEFEKALLESGVSSDSWKKELKARLLMEKVIEHDLEQKISVTPDDIATYMKDNTFAKKDHETVIRQIRKKKAELLYPSWTENLRKTYKVEINETEWKKIADS